MDEFMALFWCLVFIYYRNRDKQITVIVFLLEPLTAMIYYSIIETLQFHLNNSLVLIWIKNSFGDQQND